MKISTIVTNLLVLVIYLIAIILLWDMGFRFIIGLFVWTIANNAERSYIRKLKGKS